MKRIRLRFLAVISIVFLLNISPGFALTDEELQDIRSSLESLQTGQSYMQLVSTVDRPLTPDDLQQIANTLGVHIYQGTNKFTYRVYPPNTSTAIMNSSNNAANPVAVPDNSSDSSESSVSPLFGADGSALTGTSLFAPEPDRYKPSPLVPNADNFILAGSTNKNENLRTDVVVDNMDKSIGGGLVSILQLLYQIGLLVAVCVFAFMGVQFIIASPQQKAQLKASLYPYFIGLLLYVAGVPIATIIINIFMQLL